MQAKMEGFDIMSRKEAALEGEIFITATGCIKTISEDDITLMRDGVILMNMGHGNMEVDTDYLLRSNKFKVVDVSDNLKSIGLDKDRTLFLLADGYLVNLVGGNGHPPRVMSITYTNHVLAILEMLNNPDKYQKGEIYRIPRILDEQAARLNFPGVNEKLSVLSDEQEKYLGVSKAGPFKREDYRY